MKTFTISKKKDLIKYSIVIPISRPHLFERFKNNFLKIILPENCLVIVYLDYFTKDFFKEVVNFLILMNKTAILIYNEHNLPVKSTSKRRIRIAKIHTAFQKYIEGEIVFGIEDDSLAPEDSFIKLKNYLNEEIAFATGIQPGRHLARSAGVYKINENQIYSLKKGSGIEEIDGGGLYCFATFSKYYKKHNFLNFEIPVLGPDVNYVYSLRKQGLKAVVDWDLDIIHMAKRDLSSKLINCRVVFEKKDGKFFLNICHD